MDPALRPYTLRLMLPPQPTHRIAPDPAALAQGYRALARARTWTLVSFILGALLLVALVSLEIGRQFELSLAAFVFLATTGGLLGLIPLAPPARAPLDRSRTPSANLQELVELLEHACERLELGQDVVFDTSHMDYIYHGLDDRDRTWLDMRSVPRERLFDMAANWTEADDREDPELCRAIHREASLILAAILDQQPEDPYRAHLRSYSLADLLGLAWLHPHASEQDATFIRNRRLSRQLVRGTVLGCVVLAFVAMLAHMNEPLGVCIPVVERCRVVIGKADLEFAGGILIVLLPLMLAAVGAAQRFVVRRSFALALPE
jgi:hypothetical protein